MESDAYSIAGRQARVGPEIKLFAIEQTAKQRSPICLLIFDLRRRSKLLPPSAG
jgi:hypothetical protein